MLGNFEAVSVLGVKDLGQSRKFYTETIGLQEAEELAGGLMLKSGNSKVFIYETEYAGTNKATAISWIVDDLKSVIEDLGSKGVKFEHYDMPGVEMDGDVHMLGDLKNAWFVDPSGNIISVSQYA